MVEYMRGIGAEWPIYQECLESAVLLRSSLFWYVTWCWYVVSTHVLGHPVSSIFKVQDCLTLLLPPLLLIPLLLFPLPPLLPLLSHLFFSPLFLFFLFFVLFLFFLFFVFFLLLFLFFLLLPPFVVVVLLLLAVQPLMNLSLFQNCPSLLSVLQVTSPVPHTLVLSIFLNWLKPPQLRFSYMSSAFWFKNSKLSARIQFLHFTEMSQPPQSSSFYHLHYVWFIVEHIKLIIVACSPCIISVNSTKNHSQYSSFKDSEHISILWQGLTFTAIRKYRSYNGLI